MKISISNIETYLNETCFDEQCKVQFKIIPTTLLR